VFLKSITFYNIGRSNLGSPYSITGDPKLQLHCTPLHPAAPREAGPRALARMPPKAESGRRRRKAAAEGGIGDHTILRAKRGDVLASKD
jgi:hypothetical protein